MIWKYFAWLAALAIIAPLPTRLGYFVSRIIADMGFLLAKATRQGLSHNIRHVLGPDSDEDSVNHFTLEAFRNTGRNGFDLITLPRFDPSSMERKLDVRGWHHFEEGLTRGKGVVLASIHMGNMDMSVQIIKSRSVELTILTEVEKPVQLYRLNCRLRGHHGISLLPVTFSGIKEAIKRLQKGEVVAIACDRAIQGSGRYWDFFGKKALLPVGGVELAYRTGAAIVPAFTIREDDDRYTMFFEAPIYVDRQSNKDDNIRRALAKIVSHMERYIGRYPGQWMVYQPVWVGVDLEPAKAASLSSGRRELVNEAARLAPGANGRTPEERTPAAARSKR